jgi:hypothetical protein
MSLLSGLQWRSRLFGVQWQWVVGDYYDACVYLVIYSREAQRGGGDVDDRAGWTVVEVVEIPCGRDCELARYDCGTLRSFEDRVSYTTCLGGHWPGVSWEFPEYWRS